MADLPPPAGTPEGQEPNRWIRVRRRVRVRLGPCERPSSWSRTCRRRFRTCRRWLRRALPPGFLIPAVLAACFLAATAAFLILSPETVAAYFRPPAPQPDE